MAHYIDKDALVAEIEKRKKRNLLNEGAFEEDIDILSFIDNLEIKKVDLEKEIDDWYNTKASKEFENVLYSDIENCAKHFFALGLKTSNTLTWEDIKTIDKLLNQCVDYSNPYQEVLKRFKAQKVK